MTSSPDPVPPDPSGGRGGSAARALAPLIVGAAIAISPVPAGLAPVAWRYFGLFAAVIVALVLEPIPGSAAGLIGVTAAAAFRLTAATPAAAIRWALGGFGSPIVWLVLAAFIFARGYQKTGLGRRIALGLVRRLGGRTIGLGYAVMLADLALAPFTPSNTARSAGTIFPIVSHIPPLYDSHPGPTARRMGAYLMWTAFAATTITSSMFLTGLAPNLLAAQMVRQMAHVDVSVSSWFAGVWPVGVLLLAALPLVVYVLYPPEITESAEIPVWAGRELAAMGPMSRRELLMGALVLAAIAGWIFGRDAIDATTVALAAVSLMLVLGLITWDDVVGDRAAWNVWALLATLVTLAEGLHQVGFIAWVAQAAAARLSGFAPTTVMVALVAIFFFIHYMFASVTAHTTAVLPVVLAAGVAVPGIPIRTFALLLCYSLGVMGVLTPYATGPAPVYFGSGYISRGEFWRLGLVFGVLFFVALIAIGVPYLTFIG